MMYKTWDFEKVIVKEKDFDYDCHQFDFFNKENGKYLGVLTPQDSENTEVIVKELDDLLEKGYDPIQAGWEDGNGNTLSYDGWGCDKDIDEPDITDY